MALIDHGPRSATVTASTDCTLAEIDEKRFLFLVQQTPIFALNVMRTLSHRLRRMNLANCDVSAPWSEASSQLRYLRIIYGVPGAAAQRRRSIRFGSAQRPRRSSGL
jgi:CRP-like cAMP-binding protein